MQRTQASRTTRRSVATLAALALFGVLTACQPYPNPTPVEPGCSVTPTAGLESRTLGNHTYLLLVPPGLPSTGQGVPIVVSLHGFGSNGSQIANYTPWKNWAASRQFIAVYPNSLGKSWDHSQGSAEVEFVRDVITTIEATYCTDRSRVHVDGHSEGAYMAQRMACDAPDIIASVTEFAGGSPTLFLGNTPCTPSRGIALGMFHGDADPIVPIALGRASRDQWRARLHCDASPTAVADALDTSIIYDNCDGGAIVTWREYVGQKHLWPTTGAIATDMNQKMWEFFMAAAHPTR